MTRFVVGDDRSQSTLFPERLEDYLSEDNPVRAIDIFVDELDLAKLGFGGVEPEATGRPAYHPRTLLKIYVYGRLGLNSVPGLRRLVAKAGIRLRSSAPDYADVHGEGWIPVPLAPPACPTSCVLRAISLAIGPSSRSCF